MFENFSFENFSWEQLSWPWLVGISVGTIVFLFVMVAIVLSFLPRDYFVNDTSPRVRALSSPLHIISFLIRNVLGIVLVVVGLILVLPIFPLIPGSGFLVSAVGLIISDIPGRKSLLRMVVRPTRVRNCINWVRRKFGRDEMEFATVPVNLTGAEPDKDSLPKSLEPEAARNREEQEMNRS